MELITYFGLFFCGALVALIIIRRYYKRKIGNMIPLSAAKSGACQGIDAEYERLKRR